jgi:hypothetical protein
MVARRHHFLSQCYLRGFVPDSRSPRLFVVDLKAHRSFSTSPENVALEMDFHSIDVPGQQRDILETQISKFESDLGPALIRIASTASLADSDDRNTLFLFMALARVKNPQHRLLLDGVTNTVAGLTMKAKAADPATWDAELARARSDDILPESFDSESLRQQILNDEFNFKLSVPAHLKTEFDLLSNLLPHFHERKWIVLKAPVDHPGFITSDAPVSLMWQDPSNPEPPGLGLHKTQILFPVTSHVAIAGASEFDDRTIEAGDALVAKFNGNILRLAHRQIYARGDDFRYKMTRNPKIMLGSDLLDDIRSTMDQR